MGQCGSEVTNKFLTFTSPMHGMSGVDEHIKALHEEIARFLREKKEETAILDHIVSKGYDRHYAEMVLNNVKGDVDDRKGFWKTFFYGFCFLLSGVIVSLASRRFAIASGALFYIFYWGLIVAGISIMARAFILFRR